jgi:hypothetical protein
MARVPAFAKAFAGRWRLVEMDTRYRPERLREFQGQPQVSQPEPGSESALSS